MDILKNSAFATNKQIMSYILNKLKRKKYIEKPILKKTKTLA